MSTKDEKIAFFDQIFDEKSVFGGAGKDFGMEKSAVKKSWKNWEKSPIFRKRPIFCRFFSN